MQFNVCPDLQTKLNKFTDLRSTSQEQLALASSFIRGHDVLDAMCAAYEMFWILINADVSSQKLYCTYGTFHLALASLLSMTSGYILCVWSKWQRKALDRIRGVQGQARPREAVSV